MTMYVPIPPTLDLPFPSFPILTLGYLLHLPFPPPNLYERYRLHCVLTVWYYFVTHLIFSLPECGSELCADPQGSHGLDAEFP